MPYLLTHRWNLTNATKFCHLWTSFGEIKHACLQDMCTIYTDWWCMKSQSALQVYQQWGADLFLFLCWAFLYSDRLYLLTHSFRYPPIANISQPLIKHLVIRSVWKTISMYVYTYSVTNWSPPLIPRAKTC